MTSKEISLLKSFACESILATDRRRAYKKNLEIISYEIKDGKIFQSVVKDISNGTIYTCGLNSIGYPVVKESDNPELRARFHAAFDRLINRKNMSNED